MTDVDAVLGDAMTLLESFTDDEFSEAPLDDLGRRLQAVLHIAAKARALRDLIEIALIEAMPEDSLRMGDVTIVRERATRSSWREGGSVQMRKDIAAGLANELALDVGTGEVDEVRRNYMRNAIQEALSLINAPTGIKVPGRERLSLTMSTYKEYTEGYNVRVIDMEEAQ